MNINARTKSLTRHLKLPNQKSIEDRTAKAALLSPFRYPGGKTWLRPIIRQWLSGRVDQLVEPFAGGGVIALTALNEGLAKRATLLERDPSVASVWKVMLNGKSCWLRDKIKGF